MKHKEENFTALIKKERLRFASATQEEIKALQDEIKCARDAADNRERDMVQERDALIREASRQQDQQRVAIGMLEETLRREKAETERRLERLKLDMSKDIVLLEDKCKRQKLEADAKVEKVREEMKVLEERRDAAVRSEEVEVKARQVSEEIHIYLCAYVCTCILCVCIHIFFVCVRVCAYVCSLSQERPRTCVHNLYRLFVCFVGSVI
jgi:hypothetical protein